MAQQFRQHNARWRARPIDHVEGNAVALMAGQEIRNHRIGPGPIGLHDDDLFALERGQDVFLVEYEGLVDLTGKAPFSSDVDENGMALADQLGDGGFIEGRPQAVEGACALCCFFEVFFANSFNISSSFSDFKMTVSFSSRILLNISLYATLLSCKVFTISEYIVFDFHALFR